LMRREEGVDHTFDDLASGLDTGAISRGRVIKLAGAALVASALGFVGAREADAAADAEDIEIQISKRRCRERGGDFCSRSGCRQCCGRDRDGGGRRRNKKACCGRDGCNCCRRNQRCDNGKCKR
jgi:hypothetical protein